MRVAVVLGVIGMSLIAREAHAQRWQDATAQCLGTTAEWTNKVEVADVDGDGHVDMLLANGGDYNSAGTAEPPRIWKNLANWTATTPHCEEITTSVVGSFTGLSRMIKAADLDGDGDLEILTGGAWATQLKLFRRDAAGWTDVSAQLPQQPTNIGDAEFGDVDGDGDIDIVLADWGTGNPQSNAGGRTKLYRNNGQATFTDETVADMPDMLVRWSWDLELADVDGDFDLDTLVSCKSCTSSLLFRNNGMGHFTDDPAALPHFANNYEFEPMDIDGDKDLDLVTINDGPSVTEHVFVNNGMGMFADETSTRLAGTANPAGADDNTMVWLDGDNDGDADLVIGTLGRDRYLANNNGSFTLVETAPNSGANATSATLGLGIADFDEDGRLDLLQGQGEIQNSLADKVQLAGAMISFDTQPPVVVVGSPVEHDVRARIHDRVAPAHPHDFKKVVAKVNGREIPMSWYGPMLWRGRLSLEDGTPSTYQVCATDRAGNEGCATYGGSSDDAGVGGDAGTEPPGDKGGCCSSTRDARGSILLALLVLTRLGMRRRRAASRESSR
ncbi:MAG TPA: VCBS repeat-containing protein [Kofleriaceae bacterium]|nr:VCBS repeat-containing protein [Kofleriaceae bacterium]